MRLSEDQALALLGANSHGFMATQHPERGVDVGPTVYAVVGDHLGSPIDLVRPKSWLGHGPHPETDPIADRLSDLFVHYRKRPLATTQVFKIETVTG